MPELISDVSPAQLDEAVLIAARELLGEDQPTPEVLASALSEITGDATVLASDDDSTIVGLASYRIEESSSVVVLRTLATSRLVRGRGFGRLLVGHVQNQAISHGANRITLRSSPEAVPFYEGMGFIRVDGLSYEKRL